MEFAITMGMDAFRICIGLNPRNHTTEEIIRWMLASAALAPMSREMKWKLVPVELSYEQTMKLAQAWGYTLEETCDTYAAIIDEVAAALEPPAPTGEVVAYDAGLLNDWGGGNVEWWQDYIRAELGRAHDFYAAQLAAPSTVSTDAVRLAALEEVLRQLRSDRTRICEIIEAGEGPEAAYDIAVRMGSTIDDALAVQT